MRNIFNKLMSFELWEMRWLRWKIKFLHPLYQKYILPRKVEVLRAKDIIKVLFVIHELGSWKTELLYLEMLKNPRFTPQLLLIKSTEDYSYDIVKEYLEKKGYPYETLTEGESIKKKIHPDIIFYGKPYDGVLNWRYFYANNLYAVFCYVIYSFRNRNSQHLRKHTFFDFTWQLYAENEKVIEEMYDVLNTRGRNMVNTGLPFMDTLLLDKSYFENPWKPLSGERKRIIYAPHHTLKVANTTFKSPFYYATFLEYGDFMLEMAEKYKDKVQWSFKPHPLLRAKLCEIWGLEKTDAYYRQWAEMDNCQIDEGEYMGLFKHSDALIHDCGSFKLEYLYTNNPVLYLLKENPEYDYENWQTTRAMELHYKAKTKADIERFILDVINSKDPLRGSRKKFVNNYLTPPNGKTACENIINAILGKEEYV